MSIGVSHPGVDAARQGNEEALRQWLAAGNPPDTPSPSGWTALLVAVARGHTALVERLLAHGADPSRPHAITQVLPGHLAARAGHVPILARLLALAPATREARIPINGHTPLLQAAAWGRFDAVRFLLAQGADPDVVTAEGQDLWTLAAPHGDPALDPGLPPRPPAEAPPPIAPKEPLAAALIAGLRQTAHDPGQGRAVLAEVTRLVVEEKADLTAPSGPQGQPPLVMILSEPGDGAAVGVLRLELARFLLAQGADPLQTEVGPTGANALGRAAAGNALDILKLCAERLEPASLALGLNHSAPADGRTALHETLERALRAQPLPFEGWLTQTRWLVAAGADPDAEDDLGVTPRHLAHRLTDPGARYRMLDALAGLPR
ncbi:ankyrin repeat domain-containing protein [Pararhodospirillum photometricum]|uniref:Ankyrin n=1 Tax=Pararhodospirillum photometricum DSM 122 TaxID=1150469 RepID=H6SQH4_PARPM|nr:ankyrin repeat domain-containing protein [Pararhodospirillum photometricum]CCG09693.1 Ankyrin [Pararhodospirillum photometricum DSM 122]